MIDFLFTAITNNETDVVLHCIFNGVNINGFDQVMFRTPLLLACELGNLEIIRILLEYKADLLATDALGRDVLKTTLLSSIHNKFDVLFWYMHLIQKPVDLNEF